MVNTGFYDDVKAETWSQKMSMKLLPYYSHRPETVGRLVYRAAVRGKRVEMVSVLNRVMSRARALPLVPEAIAQVSAWILTKHTPSAASAKA
jgi:hypothetical protein